MTRTVTITLAFAALLALNGCVVYGGPYYHPTDGIRTLMAGDENPGIFDRCH